MTTYTTEEKIVLVQEYYKRCESIINATRAFCTHFNLKSSGPSKNMVSALIKKFETYGTVDVPNEPQSGRPVSVVTEDNIEEVRVMFEQSPTKSTRHGAQQAGISRTSLRRILTNELQMFAYKVQFHQPISEKAISDRLAFANAILEKVDQKLLDVNCIWFSDEAHFALNGYVNKQNFRHWGSRNPHICEVKPLHPQRITAWCAITGNGIAGPFWFTQTVNAERYCAMLSEAFFPFAEQRSAVNSYHFQQDGARPHRTQKVFDLLKNNFQDRIIGLGAGDYTGGGIDWPPYSPDLNPCDFFLWGYLKDRVYKNKPTTLDELKEAIKSEIREIPRETYKNVAANFVLRLRHVIAIGGGHFETIVH